MNCDNLHVMVICLTVQINQLKLCNIIVIMMCEHKSDCKDATHYNLLVIDIALQCHRLRTHLPLK